jgi:hypothetical protein
MEELNHIESFESFGNRIADIFKSEGLSASLLSEIDRWHDRRYRETDEVGGTIRGRVMFQIELARLYIITERNNLALDTLNDAWTEADQEGLIDLTEEIAVLIDSIS